MFKYHAYGLNISSEIELNELIPREFSAEADITLNLGEVPEQLTGDDWHGGWWQSNENYLLCDYTNIIRALVSLDGSGAIIQVFTADLFQLRSFLYSRVFSALLLAKGYYLLHGASVKIGDEAVAFCGPSGVGKSSLAYAFMKQGYMVYSDDIVCLKFNAGKIEHYPGFPRLRLNSDSIVNESNDFHEIKHFPQKSTFLGESEFSLKPLCLNKVFVLSSYSENEIIFQKVDGWKKTNVLERAKYRARIESHLFSDELLLKRRVDVSNLIDSYFVYRPRGLNLLNEFIESFNSRF